MTASTTSASPTTPPVTPAINTMFAPGEDFDVAAPSASTCVLVDCAAVPVRVDVANVVDGRDACREVSAAEVIGARMGDGRLVDFGVPAGAEVESDSTEAVGGGAAGVEITDDADESAELDGAVALGEEEEEEDTDVTAVGPATGTGSAGATEISKGGLYS